MLLPWAALRTSGSKCAQNRGFSFPNCQWHSNRFFDALLFIEIILQIDTIFWLLSFKMHTFYTFVLFRHMKTIIKVSSEFLTEYFLLTTLTPLLIRSSLQQRYKFLIFLNPTGRNNFAYLSTAVVRWYCS